MKRLNKVLRIAAILLIGTLVTQTTAFAQIGPDPSQTGRPNRVVGLWDVDVTITNCNGVELFTFPAMHKYERGGTGQVVPSSNPASLSAHMLVWNHAGGNDFQTAMKMFRFDGDGNYAGWVVVTSEVSINEEADEYSGSGIATFYNAAGVAGMMNCPIFSGTRFTGE